MISTDKFLARRRYKENSPANPSFHVYYGVSSGEVPFFWESRPGTPKHAMAATTLPPLTPPPSYYTSSKNTKSRPITPNRNLIHAILPRLRRKRHLPSPPTHSADSSSTSSCATSSFSSSSRAEDGEISPNSTLCFGERLAAMAGLKKALMAVVGNRSRRGNQV